MFMRLNCSCVSLVLLPQHDFCWVCLGPWEPHGSSWYNCNRYGHQQHSSAATLGGATLSGATLSGATLSGATLSGATLGGATLSGSCADLREREATKPARTTPI